MTVYERTNDRNEFVVRWYRNFKHRETRFFIVKGYDFNDARKRCHFESALNLFHCAKSLQ